MKTLHSFRRSLPAWDRSRDLPFSVEFRVVPKRLPVGPLAFQTLQCRRVVNAAAAYDCGLDHLVIYAGSIAMAITKKFREALVAV